jgi:uncharacterized protein (DUF2252 family)
VPKSKQPGVAERIAAFNAGRDPRRLERKYRAMRLDPFVFFRGAAHLYWEDWAQRARRLPKSPTVWACGDLHLENFGSYLGDNRLVYFDLNDFDEAALAPAIADLTRLLASLRLAGGALRLDAPETAELSEGLLVAYCDSLASGKARWVERATARGMVRDLLVGARERSSRALLDRRTVIEDGRRRLLIDGLRAEALAPRERAAVTQHLAEFVESVAKTEHQARFYRLIDVAARIAGTGSLGVRRYVALVRGHGGEDGRVLLDIKQARRSAMAPYVGVPQPAWKSEAHRVVEIQWRMQAISPALLAPVSFGRSSYVLRELQPVEDRLALAHWNGKLSRLRKVVVTMGETLACAQLRSASREGASGVDELIAFGRSHGWRDAVLEYARLYAGKTVRYWREFKRSSLGAETTEK